MRVKSLIRIIIVSTLFILLFVKAFMHVTSCFVLHKKTGLIISDLYENSEKTFENKIVQTEFDYRNWELLKKANSAAYANAQVQAKCDGIIFGLFIILVILRKSRGELQNK